MCMYACTCACKCVSYVKVGESLSGVCSVSTMHISGIEAPVNGV